MSRYGQDEETIESLRAQVEQLTAALTQALAQRDQMLAAYQPAADGTGPIARMPGPRGGTKASHRTPKESRWLKAVPAFVLVGWHGVRHAHWAAKVAAGVVTTGAVTTAAVVVAPHGPVAQVFGATPAASAPAPGLYGAAPIGDPSSPASLRLAGAVTRPALDAKSAGPPLSVALVPVQASPSPSPSDTSQPSPSDTPPPDTFQAFPVDSPQPTWQDTTGGRHHRQWDRQDSPQPTDAPADTSTPTAMPDTGTPAAPADTSVPSPAAS